MGQLTVNPMHPRPPSTDYPVKPSPSPVNLAPSPVKPTPSPVNMAHVIDSRDHAVVLQGIALAVEILAEYLHQTVNHKCDRNRLGRLDTGGVLVPSIESHATRGQLTRLRLLLDYDAVCREQHKATTFSEVHAYIHT